LTKAEASIRNTRPLRSEESGRQSEVRINYPGPYVGSSIIDLSLRPAKAIKLEGVGPLPLQWRPIIRLSSDAKTGTADLTQAPVAAPGSLWAGLPPSVVIEGVQVLGDLR